MASGLKRIGEVIKAQILEETEPCLFSPEEMAAVAIGAQQRKRQKKGERRKLREEDLARSREEREGRDFNLDDITEEMRLVTGIPEIFSQIFRELGLDRVLSKSRSPAHAKALFYIVMTRIANPASKSRSVRDLERNFGATLPLHKVYRMMDRLDAGRIERIRELVEDATRALLPERTARVMFFDCTTVAVETAAEDGLRQKGFSKDRKPGESQAFLALAVSEASSS